MGAARLLQSPRRDGKRSRERTALHSAAAGSLVFAVSGAVLVLEILAGRLLAPYVGLSLETYTAIIGVVLAGISAGTWAGGRLADAVDPRAALGPVLVLGGLLALATVPTARHFGGVAEGGAWYALVLAVLLSFFLPAAALSAVNPLVVKLQLQSLDQTGRVVGRLSALGTAGAIAGTFATGFLLLPSFPTSRVVLVLGLTLTAVGCLVAARHGGWRRSLSASVLSAGVLAVLGPTGKGRCDVETAYFCANVAANPAQPTLRTLRLDNLVHGYGDVRDPAFLGLPYTRRIGDVIDVVRSGSKPVEAVSIGGGSFTLPRYIAATRPGSQNTILELDEGVVRIATQQLGVRLGPRMRVRIGDARVTLRDLDSASYDLAIGDAFAGVAVPWHLATREAAQQVRRILRPKGVYVLNIIDRPPLAFLRAEARTLSRVFEHVAMIAQSSMVAGTVGTSNFILLASERWLPLGALKARIARTAGGDAVIAGEALRRFAGDAAVLTDDFAPADQLLTR